jgi:aminoglycoside phosphotransferase family enzyme/predicted kinase
LEEPPVVTEARVLETHISVLFFTGDRVFKLHKPVRFGFLDFTERAAREEDCRREVDLNRRLAPDVYLGVADITMNGIPLDHLVVMRALPEDRRLSAIVHDGADVTTWLDRIAARLASFHAGADRSSHIDEAGSPQVLGDEWDSNFAETKRFVGPVLDPPTDAEIQVTVRNWLVRNTDLLEERMRRGCVCDGHGDLQAGDIFCLDEGVRICDCLEFSDALRYGDVCADVAFLAMDLERIGHPTAAEEFVRAYETRSGAPLPSSLLHHYIGQRAYVRAKVACLQHEQGISGAAESARNLHTLALRHLRRSRRILVLVGGLPGSGKSTLAARLSAQTGWMLLRSDELRRSAGTPVEERYSAESVSTVYEELVRQARDLLEAGEGVVIDASWVDAAHRSLADRVAAETGSELVQLCCACTDEVAASRIRERQAGGLDVSEATPAVRQLIARRADAWPAATVVDTSERTPEESLACAFSALVARDPRVGT